MDPRPSLSQGVTSFAGQDRPRQEAGQVSLLVGHLPVKELAVPWPELTYSTGRVVMAHTRIGELDLVGATIYGFARSPTHPDATAKTAALLKVVTQELILGRTGCRFVLGDFNEGAHEHQIKETWRLHGWREVQELWQEWYGDPEISTCKGSTKQDQIWLSPELQACLKLVEVCSELFPSHAAVAAFLDLGLMDTHQQEWPQPAFIPWTDIDVDQWHASIPVGSPWGDDLTKDFGAWARRFEDSLDGFVGHRRQALPRACKGRGNRLHTSSRPVMPRPLRSSRHGEVVQSHSFLGRKTNQWFRQLRRLQALCQSLRAANQSVNAQVYRTQLWRSILRAPGFAHGFPQWWQTRPHQLPSSPDTVCVGPPCLSLAELYFADFEANYRFLEHEHAQKRTLALKSKLDTDDQAIFRLLRKPFASQLEVLQVDHVTTVQQVLPHFGVMLHQDPPARAFSHALDNEPVRLQSLSTGGFQIDGETLLFEGQTLCSTSFLWKGEEIAEELIKDWSSRWLKHAPDDYDQWQRVAGFVKNFMPKFPIVAAPLTVDLWRLALKGFRANSARGPDSWCRDDLLHMSPHHQRELVALLAQVELGRPWPDQMMQAIVVLLRKHEAARPVGEFRPISLLSMIYRVWGSIRTKEMLSQLEKYADFHTYGFLPGRSALQYYYTVQVALELALQSGEPLHGYVADIVKAFNHIPRYPVYVMAEQAGVPGQVLTPWKAAHSQLRRRFKVRQFVSREVASTTGMPEGDPLSCLGMILCDFYFHCYFSRYLPSIHVFSYVDNLSLISTQAPLLVQGAQVFQVWLQTLDLSLDHKKSYGWSTCPQARKTLAGSGFTIRYGARDLGAQLQYGTKAQVSSRDERLRSVQSVWAVLARSGISLEQKVKGIKQAIWPRALFASSGVYVPANALMTLRSGAMRALRVARAGASPIVRLGMLHDPELDPDCWQWKQVLLDLRQMVRKTEGILAAWNRFIDGYDGIRQPGPFSKVLEFCGQFDWHIGRDFRVQTPEGFCFDLGNLAWEALERLFLDAWWLKQTRSLHHRWDFADLCDFNFELSSQRHWTSSKQEDALLQTCQDGSFYTEQAKSHWDATKQPLCRYCAAPDTITHRLRTCSKHADVRQKFPELHNKWNSLPVCLTHHGLCPRLGTQTEYWKSLFELPDLTGDFQSSDHSVRHVFTDGSCHYGKQPALALAAWALVSPTEVLAAGPVPGLVQTIGRAELLALLAAAEYATQLSHQLHVWLDSQWVHDTYLEILHGASPEDYAHADLWWRVLQLSDSLPCAMELHKVWSHIPASWADGPFTEWWCKGNQHADTAANMANAGRSQDFWNTRAAFVQEWTEYQRLCRASQRAVASSGNIPRSCV